MAPFPWCSLGDNRVRSHDEALKLLGCLTTPTCSYLLTHSPELTSTVTHCHDVNLLTHSPELTSTVTHCVNLLTFTGVLSHVQPILTRTALEEVKIMKSIQHVGPLPSPLPRLASSSTYPVALCHQNTRRL